MKNVLKTGGVLALAWNTNVFPKAQFAALLEQAGFEVLLDGPYDQFAHRVDNSIMRDISIELEPSVATVPPVPLLPQPVNRDAPRIAVKANATIFFFIFYYSFKV